MEIIIEKNWTKNLLIYQCDDETEMNEQRTLLHIVMTSVDFRNMMMLLSLSNVSICQGCGISKMFELDSVKFFIINSISFTIDKRRKRISWRICNSRDIFYENLWKITCAIHSYFQADQTELIPTEYWVEIFEIVFIRNKFQC